MTETKTPVRRTARPVPAKTAATPQTGEKTKVAKAKPPAKSAAPKASAAKSAPTKSSPASARKMALTPKVKTPTALAPAPTTPTAAAPDGAEAKAKGDSFKLRMLVDQVIKATGGRKKGVKELVEVTLGRLGEALARGDEVNLPGFGKVRIVKTDARDGVAVMTLKLRQGTAKTASNGVQKGLAAQDIDD